MAAARIPQVDTPRGIASATLAFFLWGILPLFWKQLAFLPPVSIIAHRTFWSLVLLLLPLMAYRRQLGVVFRTLSTPAGVGWYLLSGCFLASNWLLYVWATLNGHILEGALGYYLNPFFNMLFGAWFFGERQSPLQLCAVAIAAAGVGIQIYASHGVPWISLVLAITFALYAVIRKKAPLGALDGLTCETLLLAPIGLIWLFTHHASVPEAFGGSLPHAGLLIFTGIATATPLLCFGYATRTIRLTTLGILQFLGPTLQFLIGWAIYGEPLTSVRLWSFTLIWLAVAVYAADAIRRRPELPAPAAD
ncbi:MAG: EamA family transporter RarD [Akkermansiaceae bacterium]|nr:EamA family transporter RarD [Akkermansiaceae bacterium]